MDFDKISKRFPSIITADTDTNLLNEFNALKFNYQKIEYCRQLIRKYDGSFITNQNDKTNNKNKMMIEKLIKLKEHADWFRINNEYLNALREYNRCLCQLKQNDDSRIKLIERDLYWGRVLIYFELKLYKNCLENIYHVEKLLSVGYTENFNEDAIILLNNIKDQASLKNIEHKCDNALQCKMVPNLRYESHKNIPFMMKDIDLEYSSIFGYHLVTKRNLKPGDIIMLEKPFSAPLIPDAWNDKCCYCLKSMYLSLIPCLQCSHAMFCSRECQQMGGSFHLYECPIMSDIQDMFFPEAIIALRNTLKGFLAFENLDELTKVFKDKTRNRKDDFQSDLTKSDPKMLFTLVCNQATNQDIRSVEDLFHLTLAAAIIYSLLIFKTDLILRLENQNHHRLLMELLLHFLQIATINSFSMTSLPTISRRVSKTSNEIEHEFAIATYPLSSFLNHSCVPNVTKTNAGPNHEQMLVVVTRPIKSGSQIFDCYFSSVNHYRCNRQERQQLLFDQYNFKCNCQACQHNFPIQQKLLIRCPMLDLMNLISENAELRESTSKALLWKKLQQYGLFLKEFDEHYPCKEIFIIYKCLLRCIWLLYKEPQLQY